MLEPKLNEFFHIYGYRLVTLLQRRRRRRIEHNVLHGVGPISVVGVLDEVGWAEEHAVAEAHDEDVAVLAVLVEEPVHLLALWPISCGGHSQQLLHSSHSIVFPILLMSIVALNSI